MSLPRLLPILALLACSSAEEGPTDAPDAAHTVGGIDFRAETLVMESYPVQVRAVVTAMNTSGEDVELHFPYPCVAHLRVYRDSARTGEPAYDQEREYGCIAVIFDDTIAAGDTAQYVAPHTDAAEILGDSLPDGMYWFAVRLRPNGQQLELPAGASHLGIPRE